MYQHLPNNRHEYMLIHAASVAGVARVEQTLGVLKKLLVQEARVDPSDKDGEADRLVLLLVEDLRRVQ